jgi:glucosamine--fructose-6-phosphate aminotransferase (isomerizing)
MSPIALEGAPEFKEIAYIQAEIFRTAKMEYGLIVLIFEENFCPSIAKQNKLLDKAMNNMQRVKARGGKVIAIVNNHRTA